MIRSMTGYGRAEAAGTRTLLSVECKSVNHRHLDVSLKLPRVLAGFESDARRLIQAAVQRGRVDVSATVTAAEGTVLNPLTVNVAQAKEYAEAARTLDFLIQEINREVNTIGSKADDLEISQGVIAAKSALEKMREQVANLE